MKLKNSPVIKKLIAGIHRIELTVKDNVKHYIKKAREKHPFHHRTIRGHMIVTWSELKTIK